MKTAGHYSGVDVRMVEVEPERTVPSDDPEQPPTVIPARLEPGPPSIVCIPARLVSTEEDGTVTIDVLDPTWPGEPQRRTGIAVGARPRNGYAAFHLLEGHP